MSRRNSRRLPRSGSPFGPGGRRDALLSASGEVNCTFVLAMPLGSATHVGSCPRFHQSGAAPLPSGGVALHAARIGGGAAVAAVARGRRQPTLRPVGLDLDDVTAAAQLLDGVR